MGKDNFQNFRTTNELRTKLQVAAARTGSNVSEEIRQRLEASFDGPQGAGLSLDEGLRRKLRLLSKFNGRSLMGEVVARLEDGLKGAGVNACRECQTQFVVGLPGLSRKRADATFCSNRCRVKFKNRRSGAKRRLSMQEARTAAVACAAKQASVSKPRPQEDPKVIDQVNAFIAAERQMWAAMK